MGTLCEFKVSFLLFAQRFRDCAMKDHPLPSGNSDRCRVMDTHTHSIRCNAKGHRDNLGICGGPVASSVSVPESGAQDLSADLERKIEVT